MKSCHSSLTPYKLHSMQVWNKIISLAAVKNSTLSTIFIGENVQVPSLYPLSPFPPSPPFLKIMEPLPPLINLSEFSSPPFQRRGGGLKPCYSRGRSVLTGVGSNPLEALECCAKSEQFNDSNLNNWLKTWNYGPNFPKFGPNNFLWKLGFVNFFEILIESA